MRCQSTLDNMQPWISARYREFNTLDAQISSLREVFVLLVCTE